MHSLIFKLMALPYTENRPRGLAFTINQAKHYDHHPDSAALCSSDIDRNHCRQNAHDQGD